MYLEILINVSTVTNKLDEASPSWSQIETTNLWNDFSSYMKINLNKVYI